MLYEPRLAGDRFYLKPIFNLCCWVLALHYISPAIYWLYWKQIFYIIFITYNIKNEYKANFSLPYLFYYLTLCCIAVTIVYVWPKFRSLNKKGS